MKYTKTGILKKKIGPGTEILQEEAKRMEEKLSELKEFMMKEKEKRDNAPRMKDGSKWRSAATTKPISGYADAVLAQKAKIGSKPLLVPNPEPENSKSNPEIFQFLSSCGLEKYQKLFLDNGIDELEILMELTESHLANLSIPLGHRLKILKKIKENKGKENECVVAPQIVEKAESELGLEESGSVEMFKEAIDSYTKSGSSTKLKQKKVKIFEEAPKKVRFLDPVTEEMLPKNFKNLMTEESKPIAKTHIETFEESSATSAPLLIMHKKICWNCYKVFEATSMAQFMDKEFCGKACRVEYVESRSQTCICNIKFTKDQGFIESGIWVCSESCAEQVALEYSEQAPEDPEESSDEIFIDPVTGDVINR